MFAAPAEGTLKDFMEFAETGFAEHEQSPPNQRTHATEHYAELINRNRRYGRFRHASILPKPTRTPSNLTPRNLPLSIISIQAFYNLKIRQQVAEDEGQGVCWEANIIYSLLYERKLNTIKFSPVLFSPADRRFIPPILKGRDCFIVDSQSGYNRLYAFITDQHRIHFPEQGATLKTAAQKTVQPFFAPPGEAAPPARTVSVPIPEKPISTATPQLTLKPNTPPVRDREKPGADNGRDKRC